MSQPEPPQGEGPSSTPTTANPPEPSSSKTTAKRSLAPLPRVFVIRGPVAPFSPSIDERCFTYCSQSVRGRHQGRDPWCRSVCWRRVHKHEVNGDVIPLVPNPESPRSRALANTASRSSDVDVSVVSASPREGGGRPKKPEAWTEGRYIWYTRGKNSAQIRLEHMGLDLRQMERWRLAWRHRELQRVAEEKARLVKQSQATPRPPPPPPMSLSQVAAEAKHARKAKQEAASKEPALDPQSTTLIPLSSIPAALSAELSRRIENLVRPSRLLVTTVYDQARGGSYRRTTGKVWDNVRTGQGLKLFDKVMSKFGEMIEETEENQRKAGGGTQTT